MAAGDSGLLFSSAVTPDGSEFYYFKHVGPGEEDYRIFRATRGENSWGPAEPLDLGASFSDLYPSISPDGQRLVFASYRPAPGNTSRNRNAHLWMARRIGPRWGPPTFLRVSRLGFYHSGLWQDSTGAVFFSRTTPDWRSTSHFQLEWDGSSFSEEAHPAPQPAAEYWRQQLGDDTTHVWGSVAGPDGWAFVQVSRVSGPNRRRSPAVYYSTQERPGGWSMLEPAGGDLATGAPNFLWVSHDKCFVHYTRNYAAFMRVLLRVAVGRGG